MKKEIRFRGLKLSTLLLCFILLSGALTQAQAESTGSETDSKNNEQHYISPRLQLGLHTKASMESPIKELISSGTAIELVKTDKEYSQIRTSEGAEGWIKSKFITAEEPAVLKIEKMQSALEKAKQAMLARLQEDSAENKSPSQLGEETGSDSQLTDNEKKAYEETITKLEEELNAWEQLDRQDKLALKEQAEQANRRLKEKLAMIASVAIGEDVDTSDLNLEIQGELPELKRQLKQGIITTIKENYLLLLMVSGLSFFLGIFIVDLVNRKRHGGYRI